MTPITLTMTEVNVYLSYVRDKMLDTTFQTVPYDTVVKPLEKRLLSIREKVILFPVKCTEKESFLICD